MAYDKQTWANGDVITAAKLNHMEDGIEDGNDTDVEIYVDGTALVINTSLVNGNEVSY